MAERSEKKEFANQSILAKTLDRQLVIAFILMTVLPILSCSYFIFIYFAPPKVLHKILLLMLSSIVLLSLSGFTILRRIIFVLSRLRQYLEGVAGGDLTQRLEIPSSGEIGAIGQALNIILHRLQDEKSRMESMVESMVEGVIMLDARGQIIALNPKVRLMFGFELNQKVTTSELDEKMRIFNLDRAVKECRDKRRLVTREINVPQAESRILRSEVSLVKDAEGGVIGTVIVIRDITKEKEIDKMKTEFISTVSHELRTPLTPIREGVSQVLDGILGETTKNQREFLSITLSEIDRLTRMINDLLDISKIESGKVQVEKELVNLVALAKEVAFSFKPKATEKNLQIKENFPKEVVEIYADRDKIIQVFSNLIGNALKFTVKGHIEISVSEQDNTVTCYVGDTGRGIAPADIPNVFGKFQQFGRVAGPGKGTGLGLFIVKTIVTELHQGKIWLESQLGKGSKFIFTLPLYSLEEVIVQSIDRVIFRARREYREFGVVIVRLDNYVQIEGKLGGAGAKDLGARITSLIKSNVISSKDAAFLRNNNDIVVITDTEKEGLPGLGEKLKRTVKESIFEADQTLAMDFSWGYALYPVDADKAEELLEKASANLASERLERLKKHIMVVDDEPRVVEALKEMLKALGYSSLSQACNGQEALDKAKESLPDLIILDMKMPNMSGYEVVGRLKEDRTTKDISILIVSGYEIEIGKFKEYAKTKAIPMLSKPVRINELERLAEYLL